MGKVNQAKIAANKALEINPKLADAHNNLGVIYRDLGEFKEAINAQLALLEAYD